VGDLHQPLHAAFESDQGGRGVDVCLPDGSAQNLHWVWDSWLVDERLSSRGLNWRDYGAFLHGDISPVQRSLWDSTDPRGWADESFAFMQDEVYEGVGDACLSEDYGTRHASLIERRLKQAGLRLGALLNEIFG
jgi:hypothetical protein